ncbi:MAG: multiheme c-type cytochrome [Planctomycetota bacterium]|nr:multiheme c-type cytochrome [Planctomycetota bacterium]
MAHCLCAWVLGALAAGPVGCPGTLPGPTPPHALPASRPSPATQAVKPFAMGDPDVVLLITGGDHGRVEVCNCTGPMTAGLSRRAGLMASYRRAFDRTIALDSGNVIWVEPQAVQNRYVLEGYRRIGYDAISLGDHEWSCPPATLANLLAGTPQTYLATNVHPPAGQQALPTVQVLKKQWGGVKIAVVSALAGETLTLGRADRGPAPSVEPLEALAPRVRALKADGYAVVLIAHGDGEFAQACATATGADLIIRGDTTQPVGNLLQAAGKPMVKVGGSEVVGAVALRIRGGELTSVEYRMGIVDTRWPVASRLLQLFGAYSRLALRAIQEGEDAAPVAVESSASCGACHAATFTQWSNGPHARAYASLARVGRERDADCLPCHTGSFARPGGFTAPEKTPAMGHVGCQDCHRRTAADCGKKGPAAEPVSQDVCATCHTPLADRGFNDAFAKKFAKVRCPHAAK